MKYLKKFFTQNEYGEFVESDKFIKPHVSYITENKKVNFHKKPKSPYVPDGNATIIAKFHACADYGYAGITNACGVKSLKVDGVPIEREFPMPTVETMEVRADDLYFYINASGETSVGSNVAYNLWEILNNDKVEIGFALYGSRIFLTPTDPNFDVKKIVGLAIISDKEDKATVNPINLMELLGLYFHPIYNKYILEVATYYGMMILVMLLPNAFVFCYVDEETGETKFLDTTIEIHRYYDESIYNTATSAMVPSVVFEETDAEHTIEIELENGFIPPMMFMETCLTGISCNAPLNFMGTYTFAGPLMNANFNGIKEIGCSAFMLHGLTQLDLTGCEVLGSIAYMDMLSACTTLVVPETMKYMAPMSLEGLTSLTAITFHGKTAPLFNLVNYETEDGETVLGNFPYYENLPASGGTIYIPRNADMSTYENWITFFNMINWTYELY